MKRNTKERRASVVKLYRRGFFMSAIGQKLGISKGTVNNDIARAAEAGFLKPNERRHAKHSPYCECSYDELTGELSPHPRKRCGKGRGCRQCEILDERRADPASAGKGYANIFTEAA